MMAVRGKDSKAMPPDPLSVEQIVKSAQSYDYNPQIPLKYWLRTASTLLKEVWLLHSRRIQCQLTINI